MLGLENHPLYLMRNHFMALNAKKRAYDEEHNNVDNEPLRKMIKHSSPQEKTNQVKSLDKLYVCVNVSLCMCE